MAIAGTLSWCSKWTTVVVILFYTETVASIVSCGRGCSGGMHAAEIQTVGDTNKPCLQSNGLPLTTKSILAEDQGPVWEETYLNSTACVTRTREKLITNTLADLADEVTGPNKTQQAEATRELKRILQANDFKLIPTDVYFISRIIEQAVRRAKTPDLCMDLLSIYNRLMGADREILRASMVFNATNELLSEFETCIDSTSREVGAAVISAEDHVERLDLPALGVRAHLAANLSVFYIDPEVAKVIGMAIYNEAGSRTGIRRAAFGDYYYGFLYPNVTIEYLLKENGLEMASYVPRQLWTNLTKSLSHPASFIVKVYWNDALFNELRLNTTRKVFTKIGSLTIPGVTGSFQDIIPIIFRVQDVRSPLNHSATGCGYWNYDTWVSDGVELIQSNIADRNLIACGTHHMTPFAYLIGGAFRHADFTHYSVITAINVWALNIITLVGCGLTMLGLFGIFATGVTFKSWRSKASSKILLHMCLAILFQMTLFCFVNTHDMTMYLTQHKIFTGCVVVGALLQYSVLVEFTWMLLIAFFQFQRYVQVFVVRPSHFILKSAILAWGLPIISPAILIAVDRASYMPLQKESMVCYPSGNGLHFGVLLPIELIIVTNVVIFVTVVWNIRHTMDVSSRRGERNIIFQHIRLMVMMFFLFGFSWIFGLLAAMDLGVTFSYLFCITATLQGFVLFLYFVILDPETRKLWSQVCCTAEKELRESETKKLAASS